MVELIPAQIEDTIILNVSKHCGNTRTDCKDCCDVGVAVHNWLISTELQYVVIDLQDVKDVCRTFIPNQLRNIKILDYFLSASILRTIGISIHTK